MIEWGPPEFWEAFATVLVLPVVIRVVWSWRK